MARRIAPPIALLLLLFLPFTSALPAGYTLYRVVLWGRPGDPPPRFQQDPSSRTFSVLFPGPVPETGWEPVPARRLEVHGGAFLPADPVPIMRPRDPDPDWDAAALQGSLDLNRDGRSEVVRVRSVMIPDGHDPGASIQRVLVELLEGDRVLFGDLLEGPSGGPVRAHSVSATDFTGEGYPDLVLRLEAMDKTGIAFYSQQSLRYAGGATRQINGFSSEFRCEGYGIFDLNRQPPDFFAHLPWSARPDQPGCPDAKAVDADGLAHCRYGFSSPYLGWISEVLVSFVPSQSLNSFDLSFATGGIPPTPEQALDFLIPVFGGEFQTVSRKGTGGEAESLWKWKGKRAEATLRAVEKQGHQVCVALRLERR